MAWIYLAELEESQKPWKDMSAPSPTVKTTDTLKPSYCPECATEPCRLHPYGMTCELYRDFFFKTLTSCMEGFPVKTYPLQACQLAWTLSAPASLQRSSDLSKKSDQLSLFSKTSLPSEPGVCIESLENFAASGTVAAGRYYPRPKLGLRIKGIAGSCWPTPRATGGLCGGTGHFQMLQRKVDMGIISKEEMMKMIPGNGGRLNPDWVEWLMGFPTGWTVLAGSVMQWFRLKRGKPSNV